MRLPPPASAGNPAPGEPTRSFDTGSGSRPRTLGGDSRWTYLAEPATLLRMVAGGAGEAKLVAQMKRGAIEYCVLALVERRESYGLELVQTLSEVDGMVTSEGTIYPVLSRLRRDGAIESFWRESDSGPPRRYYRLTEQGRQSLRTFRSEWDRFKNAVDQLIGESP